MARRRLQLRGEKLVLAAKAELARMVNLAPDENPITISSLAERLRISRQSIYSNGLREVVKEFAELQKKSFPEVGGDLGRRSLEQRIDALEQENKELKSKLDSYIERWVAVEYNARMLGVDADVLMSPAQKPLRSIRRS